MKVRALLGKKVGMTQIFADDGTVVPVTVVEAGPCVVLEKKSSTGTDGYAAVKIGYLKAREKVVTKPLKGYFKKVNTAPVKFVREVRVPEDQLADYEVGSELKADLFEAGDIITVSGKSKGRGFSGVMRRWGFHGFRATHGVHESYRGPGSVGCSTWPGKIWKGKKMPGQYGNKVATIQNLEIVKVVPEQNLLMVRGAVPGHRNAIIMVRNSKKKWKRA